MIYSNKDKIKCFHVFIRWLKNKKLFTKFMHEVKNRNRDDEDWCYNFTNIFKGDDNEIEDVEILELINSAFLWKTSKDGHDFWQNLSKEWQEIVWNKL